MTQIMVAGKKLLKLLTTIYMFLSVKLSLQPLFGLGAQECGIKKY